MNTVGKLLIVLQLFLSIMFMAFAGAVYVTQNNWRDEHDKVAKSLEVSGKSLADQQDKNEQLRQTHTTRVAKLKTDIETHQARANEARKQLDEINGKDGQTGQLAALQTLREQTATSEKIATEEANARVSEANALREEIRKLTIQVQNLVAENRQQDDEILDGTRKLAAAITKDREDQATIARMRQLLVIAGIDPKTKVDPNGEIVAEGREPAEHVNGEVLSARRQRSVEFVHISLGQDDGVEVGHRLHIFRDGDFIADIILREVNADESVGVVDENLRKGTVQRGDNVTSKL